MEYTNPGYAAASALENFVAHRDAQARQARLDALKEQKDQIDLEEHRANAINAAKDRDLKDFEAQIAAMVPGDVADKSMIDTGKRLNRPVPVKIQAASEVVPGPTEDGQPPTADGQPFQPEQRIYLGSPQYRIAQKQAEEKIAAAQKHGHDMAAAVGATDPKAVLQAVLEAGGTTEDAKRIIDASGGDSSEVDVMRVNPRTGKMESLGKAPKGSHFVTEPPPVTVNVAGAKGANGVIDEDGLRYQVDRYLAGTADPSFGSGTVGATNSGNFRNMLAKVAKERNIPGAELARLQMRYKAESGSAASLQKNFDLSESKSNKALMDLKQFEDMLNDIPDVGVRLGNKAVRAIARQSSPKMAEADGRREALANEYAGIISNTNGGVLTDSAKEHMREIMHPDSTREQYRQSFIALQQEAQNRLSAYGSQLDKLYGGSEKPKSETPEQRRQRLLSKGYLNK